MTRQKIRAEARKLAKRIGLIYGPNTEKEIYEWGLSVAARAWEVGFDAGVVWADKTDRVREGWLDNPYRKPEK